MLSVVIPLFNESGNIRLLLNNLNHVLEENGYDYEVIFVNDGSTDGSFDVLESVKSQRIRVISFKKRCGQSAAIATGFFYAKGSRLIAMDADLQNDPHDIPRLLNKLEEGYDLVNGWRVVRQDCLLTKVIPSFIANKIISLVFGIKIHDIGCTFKAYKSQVSRNLAFCENIHRYIPLLAIIAGFKVTELKVNHFYRVYGKSKYGLGRLPRVIADIIRIFLIYKVLKRPVFQSNKISPLLNIKEAID